MDEGMELYSGDSSNGSTTSDYSDYSDYETNPDQVCLLARFVFALFSGQRAGAARQHDHAPALASQHRHGPDKDSVAHVHSRASFAARNVRRLLRASRSVHRVRSPIRYFEFYLIFFRWINLFRLFNFLFSSLRSFFLPVSNVSFFQNRRAEYARTAFHLSRSLVHELVSCRPQIVCGQKTLQPDSRRNVQMLLGCAGKLLLVVERILADMDGF